MIVFYMLLAGVVIGLLDGHWQTIPSGNRKVSKRCKTSRNSKEAARLIDDFLTDRMYACDFKVGRKKIKRTVDSGWNAKDVEEWVEDKYGGIRNPEKTFKEEGLRRLNRLAHRLGCEIIIRQAGLDNPEDEFARQVKTFLRKEHYYREPIIKIP